ncbi:MAG: YggS family pyridoxal phosphate-dependent enzyme [Magnetococcales bacterium]|nr:YggS family pyridoxal phosphate-dependent enzyme [Magnetococcales bacterium]
MNAPTHNLTHIQARMIAACGRAGRAPDSVRLVAVSKTRTPEEIRSVATLGQVLFAENRVQEARDKIPLVAAAGLEWHLIGPLQRNKVKTALQFFQMIHSVDSIELAREIAHRSNPTAPFPVLMQVNIGCEPQKSGVLPNEAQALAQAILTLPGIALRGLMTIPPWSAEAEAARPWFQALAQLRDQLMAAGIPAHALQELSMGMSNDFEVAIEEGATLVRIGSAVFAPA